MVLTSKLTLCQINLHQKLSFESFLKNVLAYFGFQNALVT